MKGIVMSQECNFLNGFEHKNAHTKLPVFKEMLIVVSVCKDSS
jgi:hypothetical protein